MTETFYRLHSNDQAPCFCAEHAYSGLWGGEWSQDGSQSRCTTCLPSDEDCRVCGGTGWEDAIVGYSCCSTAGDLVAYMGEHHRPDDDEQVVIFEGRQVGAGFDGEPLAIPTGRVQWITWAELVERAKTEAGA